MSSTLNVRMGESLKERGDKVLRENGMSASTAVRALWQEMADTRSLPDFLQKIGQDESAKQAKIRSLDALVGIAEGSLSGLSDEEIREIGVVRNE